MKADVQGNLLIELFFKISKLDVEKLVYSRGKNHFSSISIISIEIHLKKTKEKTPKK